ncbi:MAG TPA: ABC transporter ATP-binding protein [Anaerolineales bacterium]|jgi:oligopeptide transport system ATP-binding protein|nr:ABC transporter ATP-binding protein [Anaerolineales bacterium]
MEPILELKNLEVNFNTLDGVVHAVNDVSYSVKEGKTLGIVGESGCGKSVSVLSIMRLIQEPPGKIKKGKIYYRGQDLLKLSEEEMEHIRGAEIGMVFQDPMTYLNPVLTIGKQISESLVVHKGMTYQEADEITKELLNVVGIPNPTDRMKDYPHQFSGGMRQRVMIAMALSCNPRLLIADEPTTALDVTIQAQIVELTKSLQENLGMAVIWITHDLGVVADLADDVVVMYAGYVVEEADVFTIYENPQHPYTNFLLKSLPRIDNTRRSERLATIPGFPPDGITVMPGCPLMPRCKFAVERCNHENPPLREIAPGHKIACWVEISTGKER